MPAIKRKVKPHADNSQLRKPFRKKISKNNTEIEGRWEMFAIGMVKGLSLTDAYHAAGYYGGPNNAHKLTKKPEVAGRIAELRAQIRSRMKITVESLVMDLQDHRDQATALDKPGDAITATMAIAKLLGLLVEKSELNVIMKPALAPTDRREITIEEWQAEWTPKALPPPSTNGHG